MSGLRLLRFCCALATACSLHAEVVLFTDLGPPSFVYDPFLPAWGVQGSGPTSDPTARSYTNASLFTLAGSGIEAVSQIDLAVSIAHAPLPFPVPNTFYASVWTDAAGVPGVEVSGAYWSLSTSTVIDTCCSLVSVTGISGVQLTGGVPYFMVLGPLKTTDRSALAWNFNNQGATGPEEYSFDGGITWNSSGPAAPLGAFDVLSSAPEPPPLAPLGVGIALLTLLNVLARARTPSTPSSSRAQVACL